ARDQDREPSDSGQYGIAARWYSEDLNNTEFGFYFMNYHSRLPIASERITYNPGTADFSSYMLVGGSTGVQSRFLPIAGCNAVAGDIATDASGTLTLGHQVAPNALYGLPIGLS